MNNVPTKLDSQAGVSLVELLVVTAIIAVVASIAFLQQGSANAQFQRQNASRELKVAFERARFDSVKRRVDGTIPYAAVIVDETQFTLVTDSNSDGDVLDPADQVVVVFAPNIRLAARTGLNLPLTVNFNRRGEPSVSSPEFVICNGTCDFSNDTPSNADILLVTPTGTVNLLPGGSPIPSFTAPSQTSISNSSGIEPLVRLP